MNNLVITEQKGLRVLTTDQLAENYETTRQIITNNFSRNRDRYVEGKHFILVKGAELKELKAKNQFDVSPNAHKFYFWTEKGALLHAKSLNTDTAWDVYDMLVDNYFKKQVEVVTPSYMIDDPIERAKQWIVEQEERNKLESDKLVLGQRLAEAEPKVTYYDRILQSTSVLTVTQISKDYGMGPRELNKLLKEEGIQYKQSGQWFLYAKYQDKGYTKSTTHMDEGGNIRLNTKWTQKGRLFIHQLLESKNIFAVEDKEDATA